ncbi:PKD domain-containing protein [Halorussus marinus]|uniref:PKD domain-containing protein n=1 Tax=Halorussus marinus TaxID=2505976 RepID=UPI00106ED9D6|nr:PKD domain-containing protein [Halorussus marinus]
MSKSSLAAILVLVVVPTAVGATVPAATDAPLADAGLDQEVNKGATVHLDGTGSRDPDGEIGTYRWTIRAPSNKSVTPNCRTCPRTSFVPAEVGRYSVTLTVVADDGTAKSDTLYVDVTPGAAPDISLSGPETPTVGDSTTYTADLDRGAGALDFVVWTVDGVTVANHSVAAEQGLDTIPRRFPTTGARTLTATVHDVDGQTASSSLGVTARSDANARSRSTPERDRTGTLADRATPVVDGDAVVTGAKPLRARYEVQLDAAAANIESIAWHNTSTRIGTGARLVRAWAPGDHELYAVVSYTDGSENVATFSNGSTAVVADPRPNASIRSLDRFGSVSGSATAEDEYENLETVRVTFDGEQIARAPAPTRRRYQPSGGRHQTLRFSHHEFTPGERYEITVVAIDERGQVARDSREIVPVKEPEIVTSEFVNSPVDSYHERIDAERYTARHVLKIDLNGVDRENISISIGSESEDVSKVNISTEIKDGDDTITITSFWAGNYPGSYKISTLYKHKNDLLDWKHRWSTVFRVTPSNPELRINVLNDGTEEYITREHGISVDASGSFDPDKTDLKYIWKYGAHPENSDNTTAKFSSYKRAVSIIEDQYDLRTKRSFDFLDSFTPGIKSKEVLSSGLYGPNDVVRVRIETKPYFLSKRTYYDDLDLAISVKHREASIERWERVPASSPEHSDATENPQKRVGVVNIPVSALSKQERPKIVIYNKDNPKKEDTTKLPRVDILTKQKQYWKNPTVIESSYLIEKPRLREVSVDTPRELNRYLLNGYSINERNRETNYVIERKTKIKDAVYETETRTFRSKAARDAFVSMDWRSSGTSRREVTKVKTEEHWLSDVSERPRLRDSNLWNGELTGETRRVVVEPVEYRTEKQYEYQHEVQKTRTKTVTRRKQVPVEKTRTRTITRCDRYLGCFETTHTETYHTTETRSYEITRAYTYTVTRTRTRWATTGSRVNGEFTGKTRRVKIDDAVYETEHKIREKSRYKDSVQVYEASRKNIIKPPEYEWKKVRSVNRVRSAYRAVNAQEDLRVGKSETITSWDLAKQTGVDRLWKRSYSNEYHVIKTRATVRGTLTEKYVNERTGKTITKHKKSYSKKVEYNSAMDPWQITSILNHRI